MKVLKRVNSDQKLQPFIVKTGFICFCYFFSINFPVFFNCPYERRKSMTALLFGRGIGFKCRSGKVMVCFFKKNETKPSAKKVILFPEIGQVENFLTINRPKKRRQKAKETKEENRFDDIARARLCVFIFFHHEDFFRLQDIRDILEGHRSTKTPASTN